MCCWRGSRRDKATVSSDVLSARTDSIFFAECRGTTTAYRSSRRERDVTVCGVNHSVIVEVTLRPGIADPEGAAIERALPALGFSGVSAVRAGKLFRFDIEAENPSDALTAAQSLAERLLSNPVIEDATARLDVS